MSREQRDRQDDEVIEGAFEEDEAAPSDPGQTEEKPRGKTSKNLGVIIVFSLAGMMAFGMMISGGGGGGGGTSSEEQAGLPDHSRTEADFQEEIDRRHREALEARERRAAELRAQKEEADPDVEPDSQEVVDRESPRIQVDARPQGRETDEDGLSERERELRERAAQSHILAITGSASRVAATVDGDSRSGADAGSLVSSDDMLTQLDQRRQQADEMMRALADQGEHPPGSQEPDRRSANERWLDQARERRASEMTAVRDRAVDRPVLHEGSVIPLVLQTDVNSDLPGMITATVTRDVLDSVEGATVVIPRGTRVMGEYNSDVHQGQNRLLFAFDRAIFPDGRDVMLAGMQGADAEGASGMSGRVNTHFWARLGRAGLIGAITFGVERNASPAQQSPLGGGDTYQEPGREAASIFADVARDVLERNRERPPTITIDAGETLNVMVNRDIVL